MIVYIFLKDNISNGNVSDVLVKHYMLSFNTSESCMAFVGGMGRLRRLGMWSEYGTGETSETGETSGTSETSGTGGRGENVNIGGEGVVIQNKFVLLRLIKAELSVTKKNDPTFLKTLSYLACEAY